MKVKRGEYGYIKAKKRSSLLKTLVMAMIGIAVFLIGLFLNQMSNRNIFTVIAVLFVLPGAKSLVAYIVLFPHRPVSETLYQRAKGSLSEGMMLYADLVITSSEKVMHLDLLAVGNGQVIGLMAKEKQDLSYVRKYLIEGVHHWGSEYKVKILDGEKVFFSELSKVVPTEVDAEEEAKVTSYLLSLIV